MSEIDDDLKISHLELSNNLGLTLSGANTRIKHSGDGDLNILSNNNIKLQANTNINLLGGIVGGYDIIAPSGITTTNFPASMTTLTTLLNTTNTGDAPDNYLDVSLADGEVGQIKNFALYTDGGHGYNDARIIIDTGVGIVDNIINLDEVGKTVSLLYTPSGWIIISAHYN